jgi:hypothetical protein
MLALFAIDKMLTEPKIHCGGYTGLGMLHSLNCLGTASPTKNHNENVRAHLTGTENKYEA